MTPVLSAVNAVIAVADIPTDPSHVQDQVKMAGQAKTSMFLTWSSFCMIGNTRIGAVLVYHKHWSMVLHKQHNAAPHDLIPLSHASDSTLYDDEVSPVIGDDACSCPGSSSSSHPGVAEHPTG